jgi:hypothetical protein
MILWVDTECYEQHSASIFRVEVCRTKNRLEYIGWAVRKMATEIKECGRGKRTLSGPMRKVKN